MYWPRTWIPGCCWRLRRAGRGLPAIACSCRPSWLACFGSGARLARAEANNLRLGVARRPPRACRSGRSSARARHIRSGRGRSPPRGRARAAACADRPELHPPRIARHSASRTAGTKSAMPTRSLTKPGTMMRSAASRLRPRLPPAAAPAPGRRQARPAPCISVAMPCRRSSIAPATMPRSTSPSVGSTPIASPTRMKPAISARMKAAQR